MPLAAGFSFAASVLWAVFGASFAMPLSQATDRRSGFADTVEVSMKQARLHRVCDDAQLNSVMKEITEAEAPPGCAVLAGLASAPTYAQQCACYSHLGESTFPSCQPGRGRLTWRTTYLNCKSHPTRNPNMPEGAKNPPPPPKPHARVSDLLTVNSFGQQNYLFEAQLYACAAQAKRAQAQHEKQNTDVKIAATYMACGGGAGEAACLLVGLSKRDLACPVIKLPAGAKLDLSKAQAQLPDTCDAPAGRNSQAVAVGDLDSDGDNDVVVANYGDTNEFFRSDGKGGFTPWRARCKPSAGLLFEAGHAPCNLDPVRGVLTGACWCDQWAGVHTKAVALYDMNGDGTMDVVFGNSRAHTIILLNNLPSDKACKAATTSYHDFESCSDFTVVALPFKPDSTTTSLVVADVTDDGLPDVYVGADGSPNSLFVQVKSCPSETACFGATYVSCACYNTGAICFMWLQPSPNDTSHTMAVVAADVTGDGLVDLLNGNLRENVLFAQKIPQYTAVMYKMCISFTAATPRASAALGGAKDAATTSLLFEDLDGDGRRDIYVGNDLSANVLLLNKGRGAFEAAARFPVEDPVWGAVTRAPGCIKEFRGATVAEVSFSPTQALAAGDVNGDGLADLFVANAAASSGPGVRAGCKLCSIKASEVWGKVAAASGSLWSKIEKGIEHGLEKGEGGLLAKVPVTCAPSELWLGVGKGHFRNSGLQFEPSMASGAFIGDLHSHWCIDRDGGGEGGGCAGGGFDTLPGGKVVRDHLVTMPTTGGDVVELRAK